MSESINWLARDVYRHLTQYHRGDLLMLLNLHTNARNRCWPSIDTLAKEMDLSPTTIINAKRWLIEVGAITLVPISKREGKEVNLPVAKHVYQLTGFFAIDGVITPYFSKDPSTIDYAELDIPESVKLIFQNLEYPKSGTKVIPDIEDKVIPDSLVPFVSQKSHATPCETPKTEHDPDGTDTQGKVLETTTITPAAPRPTTTTPAAAPQPAKPKATRKPKAQPDPDKPRLKKDERYHELVEAVRALLFLGSKEQGVLQGQIVSYLWHKDCTRQSLESFKEWWDADKNPDPHRQYVYAPKHPDKFKMWFDVFTQSTDSAMMETQPDPQCPRCGGSGYVIGKDEEGNQVARPCGCGNQNSRR